MIDMVELKSWAALLRWKSSLGRGVILAAVFVLQLFVQTGGQKTSSWEFALQLVHSI